MKKALMVLIFSLSGCAWPPAMSPRAAALLNTPLGPVLEPLWEAHGGLATWERYQGVRMRFSALKGAGEGASGSPISTRELAFRFSETAAGTAGESDCEEYRRQTASALFLLPFYLSQPGWELRQDVFPGRGESAGEKALGFWAIPPQPPGPHVGYYLVMDPATRLLKTAYYQIRHPCQEGRLFRAEFGGYQWIGGLQVATEVVHREVRQAPPRFAPRPVKPADPFLTPEERLAQAAASDDWSLRFAGIQFEEAERSENPSSPPPHSGD